MNIKAYIVSIISSVVFVGDSMSYPVGEHVLEAAGTLNSDRVQYFQDQSSRYWMPMIVDGNRWLNAAWSGLRVTNSVPPNLMWQAAEIDSYLPQNYDPRWGGSGGSVEKPQRVPILCVLIGANPSATLPADQAALTGAYTLARHQAGWQVILGTILSRGDGILFTPDTDEFDDLYAFPLNAIFRDPAWREAHGICALNDFGAIPQLGPNGTNWANATWFLDKIHPTVAGAALMVAVLRKTLQSVLV